MDLMREEAIGFMTDILNVELELDNLKPSLPLLNKVIRGFLENLPFQNLTLITEDVEKRHRPEWGEIKDAMMKKHGGLCYPMNLFLYAILEALEFNVTMAHSTITQFPNIYTNDHVLVFVHDVVRKGDQYLAEVGLGCATFEAVDMSFEVESEVHHNNSITYKYTKRGGKAFMMYLDTDTQTWNESCVFDLSGTKDLKLFEPYYDAVFSDPKIGIFHNIMRVVVYPNSRQISITNNTVKVEGENGEMTTSKFTTDEELVSEYRKCFPQFDEDLVRKALTNWHKAMNTASRLERD